MRTRLSSFCIGTLNGHRKFNASNACKNLASAWKKMSSHEHQRGASSTVCSFFWRLPPSSQADFQSTPRPNRRFDPLAASTEFTPANVSGSLAALMYGGTSFLTKDAPPINACFPIFTNC